MPSIGYFLWRIPIIVPSSAVALIFSSWGRISDFAAREWYLTPKSGFGISLKIVSWSWKILDSFPCIGPILASPTYSSLGSSPKLSMIAWCPRQIPNIGTFLWYSLIIGMTEPVSYLGWPGPGEIITLSTSYSLTFSIGTLLSSIMTFELGINWQT